jgi:hypothetical protein
MKNKNEIKKNGNWIGSGNNINYVERTHSEISYTDTEFKWNNKRNHIEL